jgi:hypothetical protein
MLKERNTANAVRAHELVSGSKEKKAENLNYTIKVDGWSSIS